MSTEILILVILLAATVFGGFTAFIASQKNRNVQAWFFLGFLFNWIALIAIGSVPPLPKTEENRDTETATS